MRTGIFLDVFPMDCVPESKLCRGLHNFYCFILRKLLYAQTGVRTGKTSILRGLYRILERVPARFTFQRLDRLAEKNKGSSLIRVLTFPIPKGRKYGMKREWVEDVEDILFEGRSITGIKDPHGFLSYYYGDYMSLPPENERRWHPVSKFKLPDQ